MQTLTLDLGDKPYPIHIGEGLLANADIFRGAIRSRKVMIVTNERVASHYLDQILASLGESFEVEVCRIGDGERFKTLDTLEEIIGALLTARFPRSCTLLALGGGVVGDITGFAAASYQRGVDFVQVPTTLLAQVDSSVGGKTAVNHALGKNMIGAFYQPNAVFIDTSTLLTLSDREFAAGMAEVIKHGMLGDRDLLQFVFDNRAALISRSPEAISHVIVKSCELKSSVVAKDEREQGVRALLNLGHTFGHAIEAHTRYDSWLHGEAVAVGLVMAASLSKELGHLDDSDVALVTEVLGDFGLPVSPPAGMTPDNFIEHMSVDKKATDAGIRFVLLKQFGEAYVDAHVDDRVLRACLQASCT